MRFLLVLALVFAPGCKSMGGLASGLGHVAGGMAKVASGVGKVAGGVARVAAPALRGATTVARVTGSALAHATPAIARTTAAVARATLPVVETVAEAAAATPIDPYDDPPESNDDDHPVSYGGPLIPSHDPCNACPDDLECGQCLGNGDTACRWTPPGAFARCESSR